MCIFNQFRLNMSPYCMSGDWFCIIFSFTFSQSLSFSLLPSLQLLWTLVVATFLKKVLVTLWDFKVYTCMYMARISLLPMSVCSAIPVHTSLHFKTYFTALQRILQHEVHSTSLEVLHFTWSIILFKWYPLCTAGLYSAHEVLTADTLQIYNSVKCMKWHFFLAPLSRGRGDFS